MAIADHDVAPKEPASRSVRDSHGASETERQAFLTGLAHDLRQALTVINGTTQLAERRMLAAKNPLGAMLAAVGAIRDAAKRMARQVAELEDFAMLELHRAPTLNRRAVDLVAMAREAAARHAGMGDGHMFSVIVEDDEGRPIVGQWDGPRLERALDNLVGNALKFSPAGGSITIRVGRETAPAIHAIDSEVAVLQVRDEGVGIPALDLPHVFEWFRRAGNAASASDGAGVGLAVVQQIVKQHGGTVQAASEQGRGSTFTLRLPFSSLED